MAHHKWIWMAIIGLLMILPGCGDGGGGGGGGVSTTTISGIVRVDGVLKSDHEVFLLNNLNVIVQHTLPVSGSFSFSGVVPGYYKVSYTDDSYGELTYPIDDFKPITLTGSSSFNIIIDHGDVPPDPPTL